VLSRTPKFAARLHKVSGPVALGSEHSAWFGVDGTLYTAGANRSGPGWSVVVDSVGVVQSAFRLSHIILICVFNPLLSALPVREGVRGGGGTLRSVFFGRGLRLRLAQS